MTRATNARIAGFTFLFYIAVGITQLVLGGATRGKGTSATLALIAQHAFRERLEVVLTLITTVTALTLAVSLYGITRDEDRDLAVLAMAFRIGEGLLGGVTAAMTTLGLLWLSSAGALPAGPDAAAADTLGGLLLKLQGWNTIMAATLFALGSTLFSWLLLRGRMIPIPLAWLGVVASLLLVALLPLQLVGLLRGSVTQLMWLPMLAFEVPLALWLLIKGVTPPRRQSVPGSAKLHDPSFVTRATTSED